MIETLVFVILGYVAGYVTHIAITRAEEKYYEINECTQCYVKNCLPKHYRWEYKHTCTPRLSETIISRKTLKDLIEPEDLQHEKIPGEGKTLC